MLTKPQRRTLVDLIDGDATNIPVKPFIVQRLVEKGILSRLSDGSYALTELGREEKEKIKLTYDLMCFRYKTPRIK